ncbi:MAG: dehydrogenase [Anaerolineae bacterium]|nr:dehydrogenase [Anaerolineae bacterium]
MKTKDVMKTVQPFPRNRLLMVDGGKLARQRHTIHGLVEFDITEARQKLRRYRQQTGETLSFSTFFLACLGTAIDQDKQMHACRDGRGRVVIFDDVDVNMLFEVEVDGVKAIRPHILRGVNHKTLGELEQEIRAFQQGGHAASREAGFIEWFVRLPGFVRRLFLRFLLKNPQWMKELYGTVLLSSVVMFGRGSGWGIPQPNHVLQVTLGGMAEKPGVVNRRVEIREYLSVTVSFDHDVIDGAPAARFIQRLKKLVEGGYGLG